MGGFTDVSPSSPPSPGPCHLVVLVHGLYGRARDLHYLEEQVRKLGRDRVLVLASASNEGRTHEGVRIAGDRLATEVRGGEGTCVVSLGACLRTLGCIEASSF